MPNRCKRSMRGNPVDLRTRYSALLGLLWLQWRGKLRLSLAKFRTPGRAALSCLGVTLAGFWVIRASMASLPQPPDSATAREIARLAMLAMCLIKLAKVFFDRQQAGAILRPAEVNLLEAGPFLRQDIRAYKTAENAISILITAVFASAFLHSSVSIWLAGLIGAFLAMLFMHVLYMNIAVAAVSMSQRAYNWARIAVLVILTAAGISATISALAAANRSTSSLAGELLVALVRLQQTWVGLLVLAPFDLFARTIFAENFFPELFGWGSLAAGLVVATFLSLMWLEPKLIRRAVTAEMTGYAANGTRALKSQGSASARELSIPLLPWLGGAGPVAWRQLTTMVRTAWVTSQISALAAFIVGVFAAVVSGGGNGSALALLVVMAVFTFLFMPAILPFDFRRDLDRMIELKTLPLSPRAIAMGELLIPLVMATLYQSAVVTVVAVVHPEMFPGLVLGIGFLIPTNALVFELENLIFLLYPFRLSEFGLHATVRRTLILFGKTVVLTVVMLLALGIAQGMLWLSLRLASWGGVFTVVAHQASVLYGTICWLGLAGAAAGMLPVVAWAFRRFDPIGDKVVT